uniref:RNA (guanine-9-)-methyltransferase domain-containing protein 1 n=1 Tax=Strigamia maritima TaxID=126957 RepID=T1JGG3_STRMM
MGEYYVPDKIQSKYWPHLFKLATKNHRTKFYKHLKLLEVADEARRQLKTEMKIQYDARAEQQRNNPHIAYGLRRNSMHMFIRNTAINRFYNCNLMNSVLYGEKLVLDFGYDENMSYAERKKCVRQAAVVYGFNKVNRDPFHLYFCNLAPDSELDRQLCKAIGNLKTKDCLVTATSRSYLDCFQKEKLVYLSPDCKEDLRTFNCDDVYIIGGLVDQGHAERLTLAKAKREGLRMANLPLSFYFSSNIYAQSLNMDLVFKILLTLKNSNSWEKAFQYIPKNLFRDQVEASQIQDKNIVPRLFSRTFGEIASVLLAGCFPEKSEKL